MPLGNYQTALVTGASSGIGAATVRALTARGMTVHALARREERLKALSEETGCRTMTLDLRDRDAIYDRLSRLDVDVLIGNAGIARGMAGLLAASPEDIDITIGTNVQALIHVLRAVVPKMVERGCGHVVNIGSVAGLYPLNSVIYGASKGAIHLLNQNLRIELKGSGVRCTEICPGRVATEIFDASFDDKAKAEALNNPGIEQLEAGDIADAIIFALDAPKRMNVNLIEIQPTEQIFGGITMCPAAGVSKELGDA